MRKITTMMMAVIAGIYLFSVTASAHVIVSPSASAPGAWETYTIKVPAEKDIPTTKVTLKIPAGLEFEQYQPVPDWKVTTQKDSSGKVKSITWEAAGKGIMPGQFMQFQFVAKNPDKEGSAAWNAYQYYKDGSIVEWTGNEKSQTPHSITAITSSQPAEKQQVSHGQAKSGEMKMETSNQKSSSAVTALVLSIIALVLAVIALIAALRKRK